MANLGQGGFDASTVDPHKPLAPIPAGDYEVILIESESKTTTDGNGEYLACKFEVISGPHKGRLLFDNLNLKNPSQKAVDIARAKLSAICRAVGVMKPTDSQQLHRLPLLATVGHEKRQDTGDIKNVVKGYKKRGDAVCSTQPAPARPGGKWSRPGPATTQAAAQPT